MLFVGQDINSLGGVESFTDSMSGWGRTGYEGYLDEPDLPKPAGFTTYSDINSNQGVRSHTYYGSGDIYLYAQINDPTYGNMNVSIGYWLRGYSNEELTKEITEGKYRNNLVDLADYVSKLSPRKVFLRWGWEFNGMMEDQTSYISAWRYAYHLIVDTLQVDNIAFVFQSNGFAKNIRELEQWYPGDEYVDWMAFSYFASDKPGTKMIEFAKSKKKPIMIAESCHNGIDLSDDPNDIGLNWMKTLFTLLAETPEIKILAYINTDWKYQEMWQADGPQGPWFSESDSRIQLNDKVREFWKKEMQKDKWILQNH